MMTVENIKYLFETFFLKHNLDVNSFRGITSLTSNLEGSISCDLVFYNLFDTKTARDSLKSRLHGSLPGVLITTGYIEELNNYNYAVVSIENYLKIQKIICDEFYPYPTNNFKIVGVTGTNGKTSVVNLCTQISSIYKVASFSIGTMGVVDANGKTLFETFSTTPSYVELRKTISLLSSKYKACFLEVSSHSLDQSRPFDILFDLAAWTSFSRDHIDYHGDMESYFNAKMKIKMDYLKPDGHFIVPRQQTKLIEKIEKIIAIGQFVKRTNKIHKQLPLEFRVDYNLENLEVATEICRDLFGEMDIDYSEVKLPLGRFTIISYKESLIVVDYAHTPDALINICKAIKKSFLEYSLTVLFGCGGNRDSGKRPLMAESILLYANKIIITTDNPRFEDPKEIIDDIEKGIPDNIKYITEIDRSKAINDALKTLCKYDILLIAGKGHEEYQEILGVKHPFSDFNLVKDFIKKGK